MKGFEILPDGVRAGGEWIPYAALIKVASEKNRVEFDTYQSALDAGYSPCGSCLGK